MGLKKHGWQGRGSKFDSYVIVKKIIKGFITLWEIGKYSTVKFEISFELVTYWSYRVRDISKHSP